MDVTKWVALVSMSVAASLPAYGNSSTPIPQNLLKSSSDTPVRCARSATKLEGCLLFRDTLQDGTVDSAGILAVNWDSSQPTEIKDRTATLPEPDSGILLSIGLFALVYLARTRVLVHRN